MTDTSQTEPAEPGPNEYPIDVTDPVIKHILCGMRRQIREWAADLQTPDALIDRAIIRRSGRRLAMIAKIVALTRQIDGAGEKSK
jgi:hypothetical protein